LDPLGASEERTDLVCPLCCQATASLESDRPRGIAFSCAPCGHQWTAVDEPDDAALAELIADLFVPNPGVVSDKGMAEFAYKAADAYGFSRGWKRSETRLFAGRVKRRVAVRLLALERQSKR
jgi:hypothetical protein